MNAAVNELLDYSVVPSLYLGPYEASREGLGGGWDGSGTGHGEGRARLSKGEIGHLSSIHIKFGDCEKLR